MLKKKKEEKAEKQRIILKMQTAGEREAGGQRNEGVECLNK